MVHNLEHVRYFYISEFLFLNASVHASKHFFGGLSNRPLLTATFRPYSNPIFFYIPILNVWL